MTGNDVPYLYLAPIRGITDALFREIFHTHFSGFDAAMAPFLNPQIKSMFEDKVLQDVLPENNKQQQVIPQLLHTSPEPFLTAAKRLSELGYSHLNWNLGCPAPMVAKKKRGSGLLPFPEKIIQLLDEIIPKLEIELSIKTRLGFYDTSEIFELLPRLNSYPLKEIIIHARLGKQLYKGSTDPESFVRCQQLSTHTLVYNGDIVSTNDFLSLTKKVTSTKRWMVGRGAIMNPMIAEQIKTATEPDGKSSILNNQEKYDRLFHFHQDLYEGYSDLLSGPSHILGRLKLIWTYLFSSFGVNRKYLKKILKSNSSVTYLEAVEQLFKQVH